MSSNPYESPDAASGSSTEGTAIRKRWVITSLAALAVVGLVVALLLPAVRSARGPALRMSCANNLKQIALALHNYEDVYGSLPPACTVDAEGNPLHSWRTLILPYLEQKALYDKIDLSKPWDDPANALFRETVVPVYHCPASDGPPHHTTYLAVVAENSCFPPTGSRKLSDITDDRARTLLVVEADSEHGVPWMAPADINEPGVLRLSQLQEPPHYVVLGVCADFSIVHLSSMCTASVLRAMISIDGNDDAEAANVD